MLHMGPHVTRGTSCYTWELMLHVGPHVTRETVVNSFDFVGTFFGLMMMDMFVDT